MDDVAKQIHFARQKIVAFRHAIESYDRIKAEIATDRENLDKRERFADSSYIEAPAALAKSQTHLARLLRIQSHNLPSALRGTGKSRLSKMLERRARLVKKLEALQDAIRHE